MKHKITVYIAVHKETGKVFKAGKQVYERVGGLRAAMDASFAGLHGKGRPWRELYDVWAYELVDGMIDVEHTGS
jgi:hypothetical protein